MRVSFIRAYNPGILYQWSLPPLGLGYIIAVLKSRFPRHEFTFHRTVEELIAARPNLAGIASVTENFNHAQTMARRVKEALGVPIVVGDVHITCLPQTLPACFDVGVVGEGEETMAELTEAFRDGAFSPSDLGKISGIAWRDGDRVVVNPKRPHITDLDRLPHPDRDALGDRWALPLSKRVHVVSARGCPYNCSFCSSGRKNNPYRRFSPEYVAREVEMIRERYDPEEISFMDDLFVGHRGNFRRCCELFRERGLCVGVINLSYARANLVDNELLDLFDELNFRYVDFGFESDCEQTLRYYNKSGVTRETNQRAVDLMRGRNISVGANFIIGAPGETREDMQMSYDFVARNRDVIDRVSMGPLQPLPGTQIWTEALERGVVSETMDWNRFAFDPDNWNYEAFPLMSRTMTARELYEFHQYFQALCQDVFDRGEKRRIAIESENRRCRMSKAERELKEIKGSSLVRLALGIRNLKRGIFG